jgi:hypothetical protein
MVFDPATGCWLFTGFKSKQGYGRIGLGHDKTGLVHRVMADAIGLPGKGPNVRHTCDRPLCFSPNHLVRGTQADNMRDAAIRRRGTNKLTDVEIKEARRRHASGETQASIGRAYNMAHGAVRLMLIGVSYPEVETDMSGITRFGLALAKVAP